jgi:hypothetical protein
MKWYIGEKGNNKLQINELKSNIKEKQFPSKVTGILIDEIDSSPNLIIKSDNNKFIEFLVKKIMAECHTRNIIIDSIEEESNPIYKSRRYQNKLPLKNNVLYSKINKIQIDNSLISYHFHFIKNKTHSHLILNYDLDLM